MIKKRNRVTRAEKEKILQEMYNLVLDGYTRDYIKKYISEKYKKFCEKTFWTLFQKVFFLIKQESEKWKEEAFSLSISRYNEVIQLAKKQNDLRAILQAQERLDKIFGLETQQINVIIKQEEIKEFFDQYLDGNKDDGK